jgi:hypothetical protein
MRAKGKVRNTGDLRCGVETKHAEEAWHMQESEGPMVLMKRVMTAEGRGPGSECFSRNGRAGDWHEPDNPNKA